MNWAIIKEALKEGLVCFSYIIFSILGKLLFYFIIVLGPLLLSIYYTNWLWLILYIPNIYIGCVLAAIGNKKDDEENKSLLDIIKRGLDD